MIVPVSNWITHSSTIRTGVKRAPIRHSSASRTPAAGYQRLKKWAPPHGLAAICASLNAKG